MGFGSIQFGGLASGLDTKAIIEALLAVEALPIQKLEGQIAQANKKVSLIGTLDGLLGKLKSKTEVLGSSTTFFSHTSTVSEEGVASIEVGSGAVAGTHTLTVNALASAESWAFGGLVDKDTTTLTGSFAFQYGGATNYSIDVTGMTLEQAAAEINTQAGADVTATVVNTGPASNPSYQLVVSGDATGSANQIAWSGNPAPLAAAAELVNASDAVIVLDKLTITRETNSFDDVLPGVQIDALTADPTNEITFSVSVDKDTIKTKIGELVDAYNAVIDFINDQQVYTPGAANSSEAGSTGGPLFGDPTLNTVEKAIHGALFDVPIATVIADTTGFSMLGLVGIDVDVAGRLSIDEAEMDAKMATDLDAFMDLFVDTDGFDNQGANAWEPGYYVDSGTADSGLAATLARSIDKLLESKAQQVGTSLPGLLDGRVEALKESVSLWESTIEKLQDRLESVEFTLVQKFANLEKLMSGLNAQGDYLTSQLAALSPQKK